jgi:hypothetical protein
MDYQIETKIHMAENVKELLQKTQEYLSLGGLFNPELMPQDKVRDMLIEYRDILKDKE